METNKCLSCWECITRVFRDEKILKDWCKSRVIHCRIEWVRKIEKEKEVRLYWCLRRITRPRMIIRTNDLPFISDCSIHIVETEIRSSEKYDIWQVKYITKSEIVYVGPPRKRNIVLQEAEGLTKVSPYQIVVDHYQTNLRIFDSSDFDREE